MTSTNSQLLAGKAAQQQKLEWRVCDDDAAWEAAQRTLATAQPSTTLVTMHHPWRRGRLHALVLILLLAVSGGWWAWSRAEAGIAQVETELEAEIAAELWRGELAASPSAPHAPVTAVELPRQPGEVISHVEIRDLGEDWAVVDVTLQPSAAGPSYRQTRVYHESAHGWVRPDATTAQWGAVRQLESEYFVFTYHAVDEAAVHVAAPQLDALYLELKKYAIRREAARATRVVTYAAHPFQSAPTAAPEKWRISVDPAQQPGVHFADSAPPQNAKTSEIVVPSPAAMLLPADTVASDVLVQALLLALYNRQALNGFAFGSVPGQWLRLNSAMRLWFIWEHKLPLAIWRKPLVQWVLDASPDAQGGRDIGAPDFAQELCEHHRMWARSPLEVAVPILCWHTQDGRSMISAWRYHHTVHNFSLNALLYASAVNPYDAGVPQDRLLIEPGPYAIVLATLLEYIATTYGTEEVARFVAAIPAHREADTLIPTLFGVSQGEFEQGWRGFLVEQYGIGQ